MMEALLQSIPEWIKILVAANIVIFIIGAVYMAWSMLSVGKMADEDADKHLEDIKRGR